MKKLLFAATFATFCAPAFADEMAKCSDENLKKTEMMLMEMKDASMKDKMEMGMKELDMAKMSMKDNKDKDCMMHLDAAMKATKG
jgi:hypothetical protein